ncbi:ribosome small subunit-dependent GTPase A [Vibrio sp. UCD-FRSSP16_10]|uniref:ribosome small subunit-dependent GTPase A n=1 Tax=unclassified Vibrio TaxID=2614977 RepID=UPI0007FD3E73|nr:MULTISPECIES: ribosome small subunit-dependent GTPase A [unclassified Vibrio]OBT09496.1 ribosome small subunit-dependent GTPase A [Vibrio sp. UCD-FRSSP16_30]OBT19538.1 ribosome small subunit-dependent GTPase A [Vibrio sp. UCD-FRSSP16_10]
MNLQHLGWQPFFQQQLTLEDYQECVVARVSAHHRSGYQLLTEAGDISLPMHESLPAMTIGDWVLLNHQQQFVRLLDRSSLFSRKAPGSKVAEQFITANIDTVFIVMSLNDDFNLSRVERYLALSHEAQVEAVIVLTKADLCSDTESLIQQVQALDPLLMIECVNALDYDNVQRLTPWCTVAFLGSSGVGKSTLVNTLLQTQLQKTGAIREDDSKGRHTTTGRTLHQMPSGGILLDTPGMRELQLANVAQGISETFSDIEELASQCRFFDCSHQNEPNCAVQKALQSGELEERRLNNYLKLQKEQARNSASLAERRSQGKQLGKMYRSIQNESRARKNK